MAKKIKQFRFPGSSINFQDGASWSDNLIEGLGTIMQVGIYALPGTKFQINQNEGDEVALIINGLGVFNMDVTDHPINSIKLSKFSYNLVNNSDNSVNNNNNSVNNSNNSVNNNNFIIIDLVYEEGINNV